VIRPYDGERKPAESPSTGKRVSGHNGLTLHCKGGFMLIFHALKQNACQSKRSDRNLLLALPHVLSAARVRENWFFGSRQPWRDIDSGVPGCQPVIFAAWVSASPLIGLVCLIRWPVMNAKHLPDGSLSRAESQANVKEPSLLLPGLWLFSVVLVAFMVLWPFLTVVTAICDDFLYVRQHPCDSLLADLAFHWGQMFFRPIDVLAGRMVDHLTLDARWALLLQLPALVAIGVGLWVMARRLCPSSRLVFPAALCWLMLHSATAITLWHPDLSSQTWCAAFGSWVAIILWDALERDRPLWSHWVSLIALCVAGMVTKENFAGVCAAAIAIIFLAWFFMPNRKRHVLLAIPFIIVPTLWLALRWALGGMSEGLAHEPLYQPHLANVIPNLKLMVAGWFATGPNHLVFRPHTATILRLVPVAAIAVAGIVSLLPWVLTWRYGAVWPERPSPRRVLALALFFMLSVSASFPREHIAEHYLFGPNIGAALIVAVGWGGLLALGRAARPEVIRPWRAPRMGAAILGVIILACGLFGLASRANHFRNTWRWSQILNQDVLEHLTGLPPGQRSVRFIWTERSEQAYSYCTYLVTPALTFPLEPNFPWLKVRFPGIDMEELHGVPAGPGRPGDMILDGHDLPAQPAW
jgi:hypothetical protein